MIGKQLAVLCALAAAALCAPAPAPAQEPVPIVSQEGSVDPDGKFQWSYESGDGTKQQQSGELRAIDKEEGEVVQGSASWTDNEGKAHSLTYVADENGYQPQSDDIPVPPEIPAAIQRALDWIKANPSKEDNALRK